MSFVLGLLKNHEILSTHTPHKLIWIYGVSQPDVFHKIHAIWQNRECAFIEGFPDDCCLAWNQLLIEEVCVYLMKSWMKLVPMLKHLSYLHVEEVIWVALLF